MHTPPRPTENAAASALARIVAAYDALRAAERAHDAIRIGSASDELSRAIEAARGQSPPRYVERRDG